MIRLAKVPDVQQCLVLLMAFARESVLDCSEWTVEDVNNATDVLYRLIKDEYLKVIDLDGEIVGMIGAQREQDPWIRKRKRIRELFWYVKPEYRSSRESARLFKQWQKDSDNWIATGLVQQVSLSTQPGGSNIRLNTRGWQCVEQHWIKG